MSTMFKVGRLRSATASRPAYLAVPRNTSSRPGYLRRTSLRLLSLLIAGLLLVQTSSLAFGQNSVNTDAATSAVALAPSSPQSITGVLEAVWGTPGPQARSAPATHYSLLSDSGQAYSLNFSSAALNSKPYPDSLVGQRVSLTGTALAVQPNVTGFLSTFKVATIALAAGSPSRLANPHLSGSQPFISVLCKFGDVATEQKDRTYFVNQLTNDPKSLDNYFKELSFNGVNLQGSDAQGWYTLPQPRSFYVTGSPEKANLDKLAQDCTALAQTDNVNFSPFYGINMMFNAPLDGAAWGGKTILSVTGQPKAWPATWMPYAPPKPGFLSGSASVFGWPTESIIAHEMAHAFGATHSNDTVGYEYGSAWDVVSKPSWNCLNADSTPSVYVDANYGCLGQGVIGYSKVKMGFLQPNRILAYDASMGVATINLERLTQPTNTNPLMITIPVPGSTQIYYTVEARFRVGFDAKLPTDGVIIHQIDETGSRQNPPQLVAPPNAPDKGDAGVAWLPGMTFNDAANSIAVTVQSATTTGFVVTINAPKAVKLTVQASDSGAPTPDNNYSTTYTTTVTNSGPADATNASTKLNIAFPFAAGTPTSNPSQGTFDPNTGVWSIGTIQGPTTVTLTVTYAATLSSANLNSKLVKPSVTVTPTGSVTSLFAQATANDQIPDKYSTSDHAAVSSQPTADLDLLATVSNEKPFVGDVVTFTLSALNLGPDNASNVSYTTQLQAGLTFVAATPNIGTYNSSTGVWTIPSLPNQQEAILTIAAKVTLAQALSLTATKTGQTEVDDYAPNDSDYATVFGTERELLPYYDSSPIGPIIVDTGVDVAGQDPYYSGVLTFTDSAPGQPVSYTLEVLNLGEAALTLYDYEILGTNANDFTISTPSTFPNNIAVGGTQNVIIQCNPSAVGVLDAYLFIDTNDFSLNTAMYHLVCNANGVGSGYTYYLPFLASNAGGFTSYLALQNSGTTAANVAIQYYDASGVAMNSPALSGANCSPVPLYGECIAANPFASGAKGTGIIKSDQPLAVIVAEATPYGGSAYAVPAGSANYLVAPFALNGAYGGFLTQLTVFNGGSSPVSATVSFFNQDGTPAPGGSTKQLTIQPFTSANLDQSNATSNLPAGFNGWAQIQGSAVTLVAQVLEQNPALHFVAIANAISNAQSTLFAPAIFNNAYGGFYTGANIVNPNSTPVTVTLAYYSITGTVKTAPVFTMPAKSVVGIFQGNTSGTGLPVGGLPLGFIGAVGVTTQGGGVVMSVNENGGLTATGNSRSGTYAATASGASSVSLPVISNGGYSYVTGDTIFNTASSPVTATITYYNTNGTVVSGTQQSFTIAANGSQPFFQGAANLPANFYGTAVVTQTNGLANSLIVTTNAQSASLFYTYIEPVSQ